MIRKRAPDVENYSIRTVSVKPKFLFDRKYIDSHLFLFDGTNFSIIASNYAYEAGDVIRDIPFIIEIARWSSRFITKIAAPVFLGNKKRLLAEVCNHDNAHLLDFIMSLLLIPLSPIELWREICLAIPKSNHLTSTSRLMSIIAEANTQLRNTSRSDENKVSIVYSKEWRLLLNHGEDVGSKQTEKIEKAVNIVIQGLKDSQKNLRIARDLTLSEGDSEPSQYITWKSKNCLSENADAFTFLSNPLKGDLLLMQGKQFLVFQDRLCPTVYVKTIAGIQQSPLHDYHYYPSFPICFTNRGESAVGILYLTHNQVFSYSICLFHADEQLWNRFDKLETVKNPKGFAMAKMSEQTDSLLVFEVQSGCKRLTMIDFDYETEDVNISPLMFPYSGTSAIQRVSLSTVSYDDRILVMTNIQEENSYMVCSLKSFSNATPENTKKSAGATNTCHHRLEEEHFEVTIPAPRTHPKFFKRENYILLMWWQTANRLQLHRIHNLKQWIGKVLQNYSLLVVPMKIYPRHYQPAVSYDAPHQTTLWVFGARKGGIGLFPVREY